MRCLPPLFVVLFVWGCSSTQPIEPQLQHWVEDERLGGDCTTYDQSVNAFGNALPNLAFNERSEFVLGNSFFRTSWVIAPSSTTARDGLGPLFNSTSCSGCHHLDGRGRMPRTSDEQPVALLFRLAERGTGQPSNNYGGQFDVNAIPGIEPEVSIAIEYSPIVVNYPDGSSCTLRKPTYKTNSLRYGSLEPTIGISPRLAQQLCGLGLLEAIEHSALELNRAVSSTAMVTGRHGIGRFGWKAEQPTIAAQVAAAFAGDMGITSPLHTHDNRSQTQEPLLAHTANGGIPEISEENFQAVVTYIHQLAVPARRNAHAPDVIAGAKNFEKIGCTSCHTPTLTTQSAGNVKALQAQTIHPYTDLLLHDMGESLSDNTDTHAAMGSEWRTPPLWGIGLIPVVNSERFLLHDGRARTIEEAILWHGGEAENVITAFKNLPKLERDKLILFIESL